MVRGQRRLPGAVVNHILRNVETGLSVLDRAWESELHQIVGFSQRGALKMRKLEVMLTASSQIDVPNSDGRREPESPEKQKRLGYQYNRKIARHVIK